VSDEGTINRSCIFSVIIVNVLKTKTKLNSVARIRERIIPTK
jgi:hypothetical protein